MYNFQQNLSSTDKETDNFLDSNGDKAPLRKLKKLIANIPKKYFLRMEGLLTIGELTEPLSNHMKGKAIF